MFAKQGGKLYVIHALDATKYERERSPEFMRDIGEKTQSLFGNTFLNNNLIVQAIHLRQGKHGQINQDQSGDDV